MATVMLMANASLIRTARAAQQPSFGYPAGVLMIDFVPDDMKSMVTFISFKI